MSSYLRRLVSKQKRRYQADGFDLDLAFINAPPLENRLLAMAFPTDGKEAWYRNHFKDVKKFLQHQKSRGQGTYKIYNLTAERPAYQEDRLGGELGNYHFEDHQAPSLKQMVTFCQDLEEFLSQHPDNFAAVHCKAGKGRTGVMICAYLLHTKLAEDAQQAMEIYGQQRSKNLSGITVASQKRYVQYFERVAADQSLPEALPLSLKSISVSGLPRQQLSALVVVVSQRCGSSGHMKQLSTAHSSDGCVRMQNDGKHIFEEPVARLPVPSDWEHASTSCVVKGDIRLEVYVGRVSQSKLLFRACLNTAFLRRGSLVLSATELDKGASSVRPEACLTLHLDDVNSKRAAYPTVPIPQIPHSSHLCDSGMLNADEEAVRHVPRPCSPEPLYSLVPRLLEVHPDFSIPSNYYPASMEHLDMPVPPSLFAAAASRQLPEAEEASPALSTNGSSWQELSERLEGLERLEGMEEEKQDFEDRRAQSVPTSWSDYLPLGKPIPRSLSLVKLRPEPKGGRHFWEDPESYDHSAPTTPSLPRPFTSIDWQRSSFVSLNGMNSDETVWQTSFAPSSQLAEPPLSPWRETVASGQDSPSHAAQMIKWMSSSWWLNMA